jgi:hypothetical protein
MTSWKWLAALLVVFVFVGVRGVRSGMPVRALVIAIALVLAYESLKFHAI